MLGVLIVLLKLFYVDEDSERERESESIRFSVREEGVIDERENKYGNNN